MKIEGLLCREQIALNIEPASKQQVIDKMLSLISSHAGVRDKGKLREDVFRREEDMSTGIGRKIALPHAKTDAVTEPVLAFATLKSDLDFQSIDNEPVRIIFLLATPEAMLAEHLKLLGRITRLAGRDDLRDRLILAASPEEVLELFREGEKDFPQI
ncbi:MAG: PTS sugar transporter subunit IIA [Chlorobiaceae bacterium]